MSFPLVALLAGWLSAPVPEGKTPPPTSQPPEIWSARVAVVEGRLEIHFRRPRLEPMFEEVVGEGDGKIVRKMKVVYRPVFQELPVVSLPDAEVRVIYRDRKPVDAATLRTALQNATQVVVFPQGEADPFYLAVFREDVLVFTLNASRLFGSPRSGPKSK